jgi:hypothetical protein
MRTELEFKVGDSVYLYPIGWGIIEIVNGYDYKIYFGAINQIRFIDREVRKLLSFTEYTIEGISQERPEVEPKAGQIVWVRDSEYRDWQISHFVNMNASLNHKYFCSHTNNDENIEGFIYLTTENPYEKSKD